MKQTIALITAAALSMSVSAQSKYIVANSYATSGCGGKATSISSINTGQCYYVKEECETNQDLQPECDFLKRQAVGDDISFMTTCDGDKIMAQAFEGKGCDPLKPFGTGSLTIPARTCLLNFQLTCSNNPKFEIPSSSSSATSIEGSLLGLLGLLFV